MARVRRAKPQAGGSETTGVDLTPMLDVVFILLIFFIITASFVKEHALNMGEPSAQKLNKSAARGALLRVDKDDAIYWQDRKISANAVGPILLSEQAGEGAPLSVTVNAHEKSTTAVYASIANAVRKVNGSTVALKTYVD